MHVYIIYYKIYLKLMFNIYITLFKHKHIVVTYNRYAYISN